MSTLALTYPTITFEPNDWAKFTWERFPPGTNGTLIHWTMDEDRSVAPQPALSPALVRWMSSAAALKDACESALHPDVDGKEVVARLGATYFILEWFWKCMKTVGDLHLACAEVEADAEPPHVCQFLFDDHVANRVDQATKRATSTWEVAVFDVLHWTEDMNQVLPREWAPLRAAVGPLVREALVRVAKIHARLKVVRRSIFTLEAWVDTPPPVVRVLAGDTCLTIAPEDLGLYPKLWFPAGEGVPVLPRFTAGVALATPWDNKVPQEFRVWAFKTKVLIGACKEEGRRLPAGPRRDQAVNSAEALDHVVGLLNTVVKVYPMLAAHQSALKKLGPAGTPWHPQHVYEVNLLALRTMRNVLRGVMRALVCGMETQVPWAMVSGAGLPWQWRPLQLQAAGIINQAILAVVEWVDAVHAMDMVPPNAWAMEPMGDLVGLLQTQGLWRSVCLLPPNLFPPDHPLAVWGAAPRDKFLMLSEMYVVWGRRLYELCCPCATPTHHCVGDHGGGVCDRQACCGGAHRGTSTRGGPLAGCGGRKGV